MIRKPATPLNSTMFGTGRDRGLVVKKLRRGKIDISFFNFKSYGLASKDSGQREWCEKERRRLVLKHSTF